MTVYLRLEPPYQWVKIEDSEVQSFGEVPDPGSFPISDVESVVGIVPGEWVTTHRLKLPAKTRKQFNLALPFALEDSFTEDVEQLHFVCPKWRPTEESVVYAVAIEKLRQWRQTCNDHAIPAVRILPEYALLPKHDVADCSLALVGDKVLAKRNDGTGISIDSEFIGLWLKEIPMDSVIAVNEEAWTKTLIEEYSDRDIRHWPFGDKLANWVEYGELPEFDLWNDQFRPSSRKSTLAQYRWPASIVAVALMVLIGTQLFFYFSMHHEIKLITNESQAIAKHLIPALDYVEAGQERTFVERFAAQQNQGAAEFGLPRVLAAIAPILRAERVTLQEIRFRPEELVIECILANLSQIDSITRQLAVIPEIKVKLHGSSSENNVIVATYTITPNK